MTDTSDRDAKITFELSHTLSKAIAIDAAKRGVTQRRILLEGLKALGYAVSEADLVDRRGRPRKNPAP